MSRFVVGITGASGVCYGVRVVELLARSGADVYVIVSDAGRAVLAQEVAPAAADPDRLLAALWPDPAVRQRIRSLNPADGAAPPASGSWTHDGMVVCPCSMNTLAALAAGLADNLLRRAATVALKERRPLVVVPRETPLGIIPLENMLRLAHAGATLLPAMPGFYHQPRTVQHLVDFVAARVLDVLRVPHNLPVRWQPDSPTSDTQPC